jgi:cyanophycinase
MLLLVGALALPCFARGGKPKYKRVGNSHDVTTQTRGGFALMGGGDDLDIAFRWMCDLSGGGDFLVLRATGSDDYNDYVRKLCKVNSVATLVIPDRQAAQNPIVASRIRQAEALFIAGGDQSNYIKYWQGTPVTEAVQELIARGVPVGGTSAGEAVLGEYVFSAMNDSVESEETLKDPFNKRVTIARGFLKIPHVENTILDQHFIAREREGRLLGFMARIATDNKLREVRGIGVDEKSAVLMLPIGIVEVVGRTHGAYFYRATSQPSSRKPLTWEGIEIYHAPPGAKFDLNRWIGVDGESYSLDVEDGAIVMPLKTRPR